MLLVLTTSLFSQEQPKHEKKTYKDAEGNFYYNRHQPLYLWISTSAIDNSNDILLKSESVPQYTNPMYLDTDGYNSLRISPAVDTVTKKAVYPTHDLRFEIQTDGTAPNTNSYFTGAKKYNSNGKIYYGKGLEIKLEAEDEISGVEKIYYSINGEDYKEYTSSFVFYDQNKNNTFKYYSTDNLGNAEKLHEKNFALDFTAPTTTKTINGETYGIVLAQDATILLKSEDDISGVKATYYIIDEGEPILYTKPIQAYSFMGGDHWLSFYAVDNVGNSSFGDVDETTNTNFSLNFVVDKTPPKLDFEIIGDKYDSKYTYVSRNSTFKISATDDNSGISFVKYSFNNKGFNIYEDEAKFADLQGYQTLKYFAKDVVGNKTRIYKRGVYLDNTSPTSYIDFEGPQFFHRDTLFLNNKTNVKLFANDNASGVKNLQYSITGTGFVNYENKFKIQNNGYQTIEFKAIDNVNNSEQVKKSVFFVDNEPPEIYVNFSIQPIRTEVKNGENYPVYPPYSKMYLSATDKNTGEEEIFFSINGGKKTKYISADNILKLKLITKEQFYTINVFAKDKLGNQKEKTVSFFISKK